MNESLTIGELSKQTGLPTKTIRFYESIGLIGKPERATNGYRTYPKSRIQELVLIKNARDLGLPIPRIKKLMVGCEGGNCCHSQEYIDREIKEYVGELSAKITELSHLKNQMQTLRKTLNNCEGDHGSDYCCNVLGQIARLPKGGEEK